MLTLLIVLIFCSCYLLYNTSKRATLATSLTIERKIQENTQLTKTIGYFALISTLILTLGYYGIGTGTFIWFMLLMFIIGAVVVLAPLKIMNYKHISIALVILAIVELKFL